MLKHYDFDPNIRETICKNIKKYRKEKNVRVMDLAEAVDVCPDYIKRMESETGIKNISLTTLYKISVVLNQPIGNFFIE